MKKREAHLSYWSGTYTVCAYPSQQRICSGKRFRDVLSRARLKGYHVRVYRQFTSTVYPPISASR